MKRALMSSSADWTWLCKKIYELEASQTEMKKKKKLKHPITYTYTRTEYLQNIGQTGKKVPKIMRENTSMWPKELENGCPYNLKFMWGIPVTSLSLLGPQSRPI